MISRALLAAPASARPAATSIATRDPAVNHRVTAARRATAMLYRTMVQQAQVLAYIDDFWLLSIAFVAVLPIIPFMRRVRPEQNERARQRPRAEEPAPSVAE